MLFVMAVVFKSQTESRSLVLSCHVHPYVVFGSSQPPPDVYLIVTLGVRLDIPQRLQLINGLLENNVTLNESYSLTVGIDVNPDIGDPRKSCICSSLCLNRAEHSVIHV